MSSKHPHRPLCLSSKCSYLILGFPQHLRLCNLYSHSGISSQDLQAGLILVAILLPQLPVLFCFLSFKNAFSRTYQPIGPIVSALVFPRLASFSNSSMAFLLGKGKISEKQSPTHFWKSLLHEQNLAGTTILKMTNSLQYKTETETPLSLSLCVCACMQVCTRMCVLL